MISGTVALAISLGTLNHAAAQPLFHHEYDWTFIMGDQLYGFRDVVQEPGHFRWTEIWLGDRVYEPEIKAEDRRLLKRYPPLTAILGVRRLLRPWIETVSDVGEWIHFSCDTLVEERRSETFR